MRHPGIPRLQIEMEKGGGEEHYFRIQENKVNEERKDKNGLNTSVLFTILTICEFYKLGHV